MDNCKKELLLIIILISNIIYAQNINIPDIIFKDYLVGNSSINTDGNTEISLTEAQDFTGNISIPPLGVTDLKGIEAFTNLNAFSSERNPLISNVNFSSNTKLTKISISHATGLEDVIIGNNSNLTSIDISYTKIKTLDISGATSLINLLLPVNELTTLNMQNGNNSDMALIGTVSLIDNDLECVKIDPGIIPPASGTLNWHYDSFTQFSPNCSALSTNEFETSSETIITPNPASHLIQIKGLINSQKYSIYNISGKMLFEASINKDDKINIEHLSSGIYFLLLENNQKFKFIKN